MCDAWKENGPIVVGGLGGSGTRVVAEIMATLGYYIGPDLNSASDNLWHAFLFKRPVWYLRHHADRATIATGLRLFEKLMLRTAPPSMAELRYLAGAFGSISADGFSQRHTGEGRTKWALQRLARMATSFPGSAAYVGWGWKAPNSHLLIADLAACFPRVRYIHTIRHGLDMAFSGKQDQFYLWGRLFDIEVPPSGEQFPPAAYRFWVRANRNAVNRGRALGDDRFLLVNFDRLCADPQAEVAAIARFLGVSASPGELARAAGLVQPQASTGRYRQHGVEMFRGEDLDALAEFGFSL